MNSVQSQPTFQLAMPITQHLQKANAAIESPRGSFVGMLSRGVGAVNDMQHQADDAVHEMLTGGDVTQAEVFSSVQKADMAFQLLVQVRNKLMAAYEELNSIRV